MYEWKIFLFTILSISGANKHGLLVLQSRRLFCCPLASVAMQLAPSGLDKPEYRPNIAIVVITIIVNAILIFFNTEPLIIIIITTTLLASLPSGPREAWLLTKYLITSSSPIFVKKISQSPGMFKNNCFRNCRNLSSKPSGLGADGSGRERSVPARGFTSAGAGKVRTLWNFTRSHHGSRKRHLSTCRASWSSPPPGC